MSSRSCWSRFPCRRAGWRWILPRTLQAGEAAFPNRRSREAQRATLGGQHPCWKGALPATGCESGQLHLAGKVGRWEPYELSKLANLWALPRQSPMLKRTAGILSKSNMGTMGQRKQEVGWRQETEPAGKNHATFFNSKPKGMLANEQNDVCHDMDCSTVCNHKKTGNTSQNPSIREWITAHPHKGLLGSSRMEWVLRVYYQGVISGIEDSLKKGSWRSVEYATIYRIKAGDGNISTHVLRLNS